MGEMSLADLPPERRDVPVRAEFLIPRNILGEWKEDDVRPAGGWGSTGAVVGAAGAAGAAAGAPTPVPEKGKKAARRERAQARGKGLCNAFLRGGCDRAEGECRFSHDVGGWAATRPADLPGRCPWADAARCPQGITCRWATQHKNPDPITVQFLTQPLEEAGIGRDGGSEGGTSGRDDEAEAKAGNEGIEAVAGEEGDAGAGTSIPALTRSIWRDDGSIPSSTVPMGPSRIEVPVLPEPQAALNALDREVQSKLWNRSYDFTPADSAPATEVEAAPVETAPAEAAEAGGEPSAKRARTDGEAIGDIGVPAESARAEAGAPREGGGTAEGGGEAGASPYRETPLRANEKPTLDLRGKRYLAPLTTVGNLPFRRLCVGLGAEVTCGEMAVATNILQGQASEWALLKRHPCEKFFGVQLLGGFPDAVARAGQLVREHCDVDFVDLNFGCPIDAMCDRGAGSACLLRPARLGSVVRALASVVDVPVTAKIRKGYHDDADVAHKIVPELAAWGASGAVLHGRSRQQRYSRRADWGYIAKCATLAGGSGARGGGGGAGSGDDEPKFQFIGNGDVFTWRDHERALREAGVATTYVARGALVKPWIFTEIAERRDWDISAAERLDLIRSFASHGLEAWGSDARGVETCRRFLLEWLSFACRYVPVGLLERADDPEASQALDVRPPQFVGRSDLETLLASDNPSDWVAVSEMVLGPAPPGFTFQPKHKANSYPRRERAFGVAATGPEEQENG